MGFLERAIDFHRGSLVYDLRTCTVNILCALAPSEPPPPCPKLLEVFAATLAMWDRLAL